MLSVLAMSAAAFASAPADLRVRVKPPTGHLVYEEQEIKVRVKNRSAVDALGVQVVIDLPETGNSPTAFVAGDLGPIDRRCALSGTQLVCDIGKVKATKGKTVRVYLALPFLDHDASLTASVTASTPLTNLADDVDTDVLEVGYPDQPIVGPAHAIVEWCVGQGLGGFATCENAPGSVMEQGLTFEADGSLSFDGYPSSTHTGLWWQPTDALLDMQYEVNGQVTGEFSGAAVGDVYGTGDDCWEGIIAFTASSYEAAYRICLD